MRLFKIAALAMIGITGIGAVAEAAGKVHVSPERIRVFDLGNGQFEVVPPRGEVRDAYWCGAADYARRSLGAGWGQEIYVVRGLGEGVAINRKSTVLFSLSPVASDKTESFIRRSNAFDVGDRLSVQEADHKCSIVRRRF
ncbi:hypothetical protein [Phaeobacter sp.]|uniref:hypothetical protein n=1 Tax=Phaeobacter sp. TaxID=1902409 RepID=UPI0026012979|nr:hypothetical protein [Phaeobacter sp.]